MASLSSRFFISNARSGVNKSILFFVKYPSPGKVKTRLAGYVGEEMALGLYKCFVKDLMNTLSMVNADLLICYRPEVSIDRMKEWLGSENEYVIQEGSSLGERMKNCFVNSFKKGYKTSLVIGSDSPDLSIDIIESAFKSLEESDVVIGPSIDGGYYLIGFNESSFLGDVFENIKWSTDSVFEESMNVFKKNNYKVCRLSGWYDVDTLKDLQELYDRNKNSGFSNSNVMSYLKENNEILNL
jgi:rSAM/selenodomain-associated transferase 1